MVLNRRLLFVCAWMLAFVLCAPAAAEVAVEDYVRLHVVAADDTDVQQALKLEVRDAVLDCARDMLDGVNDADAAWRIVRDNLDALGRAARRRARACGYGGTVACEAGVFSFPDRRYGDALVPAGDYRALRVVIGAGEGRNWWCVLFPKLCYPEGVPTDAPIRFHSVIWNWLRRAFGGED